ncbi:MAG: (deoxy)nucleoside triphosphate pyrophosphohydrolase [Saprospiraceae bacterium]
MKYTKVVCGIIWNKGKVFIARRKPEKSLGGFWEFPGGKIEPDEDSMTAIQRELFEEFGMSILNIRFFGSHIHEYDSFSIELLAYECEFESATFLLSDHDDFAFVRIKELTDYDIAPADKFFVTRLYNAV